VSWWGLDNQVASSTPSHVFLDPPAMRLPAFIKFTVYASGTWNFAVGTVGRGCSCRRLCNLRFLVCKLSSTTKKKKG
jgi:hypothetical protein